MQILITGNLSPISRGFIEKISVEYECVILGNTASSVEKFKNINKNVKTFVCQNDSDVEVHKIFGTFNFDMMIYFSYTLDGAVKIFSELERFESRIYSSIQFNIPHVIYITSNDMQLREMVNYNKLSNTYIQPRKNISRGIMMDACKKLCNDFASEKRLRFKVIHVPYLYSFHDVDNQLNRWIHELHNRGSLSFRGSEGYATDFLLDEDLGELVARIIDDPGNHYLDEYDLTGNNAISLGEIRDEMVKLAKDMEWKVHEDKISFLNNDTCIPTYSKNELARKDYGWFPSHNLQDDLQILFQTYTTKENKKNRSRKRKERVQKISDKIRIVSETILLFIIAEICMGAVKNNVLLNFIDFRLVFVVIIGTMNGMLSGIIAAIIACFGYVAGSSQPWQIIFYNVENWLPFTCYFMIGAISGYSRDRHDDELKYLKEEKHLLEDKYLFLSDLYKQALSSKERYNSQIISFKDSYGKLYNAIKNLNAQKPDEVIYQAINTLEDLLDNHYIAIYMINENSDYARLRVCSRSLSASIRKSVKLSEISQVKEALAEKKIFVNRQALENYPQYAAPILRDGKVIGMMNILYTSRDQMNMEFFNKFSIITDMIRDSLVRAMEKDSMLDKYLPNTNVLQPEYFAEELEIKKQMKDRQYTEFILLEIDTKGESIEAVAARISSLVRVDDLIGLNQENRLFLLLNQTKKGDMGMIRERLQRNNISFEVVRD